MNTTRVLMVDGDEGRRQDLAFDLESSHGFAVSHAAGQADALLRVAATTPDAVVMAASLPDGDAIGLLQRLGETMPGSPVMVVLAAPDEGGLRRLAWAEGATAVLTRPVDATELASALRTLLRSRADRIQGVAARDRLAASMDRLTDLLVLILDAAVPGSARRSAEVANLAALLARGFDLSPSMLEELRLAARLHELGRFALGRRATAAADAAIRGHMALASARMLAGVPCLQELADLIEGVGANWDGSGVPAGRQRGQIPLRSRLLRVGMDLLAALERPVRGGAPSFAAAAAMLVPEAGRLYDPAVIAILEVLAAEDEDPAWQERSIWVHYDGLAEGMELAADLHTVSGIKLLSAGSVLNATTLQLIRHRHQLDPLALPVSVFRRSGESRPVLALHGTRG